MNYNLEKVNKALAPQQQAILSNVISMLGEMEAMAAGEEGTDPTVVANSADPAAPAPEGTPAAAPDGEATSKMEMIKAKMDEVNEIMKGLENTPGDGSDANSSAEEKIDDTQPMENAAAIQNVKKSIGDTVNKQFEAMTAVVGQLANVVNKSLKEQEAMAAVNTQVFKGLGIMDGIEEANKAQEAANAPAVDPMVQVAKSIESMVAKMAPANASAAPANQPVYGQTRKSLANAFGTPDDVNTGLSVLKAMVAPNSAMGANPAVK